MARTNKKTEMVLLFFQVVSETRIEIEQEIGKKDKKRVVNPNASLKNKKLDFLMLDGCNVFTRVI